jgi:hypothetical protein
VQHVILRSSLEKNKTLVNEEQPNNSIIEVQQNNIDVNTTNNNNLKNNDEPRIERNDNMVEENIEAKVEIEN